MLHQPIAIGTVSGSLLATLGSNDVWELRTDEAFLRPTGAHFMENIRLILEAEQRQVDDFIRLFKLPGLDPSMAIYDEWNAHDILVHVLVWHESFARNVDSLARGLPPILEYGRIRDITERGLARYGDTPTRTLLRHLRKAQRTIDDHIMDARIELIPYRSDGPSYTPAKHLDIVRGHIRRHFWDVLSVQLSANQRLQNNHATIG